jgi:CHAT domain-containing protein
MLIGSSCDWRLPWAVLWPRDHGSQLRQDHAGETDPEARGFQAGNGRSREDNRAPHDDRYEAGMRDQRGRGGGKRFDQWEELAINRTPPSISLCKMDTGSDSEGISVASPREWRSFRFQAPPLAWAVVLLVLVPLQGSLPGDATAAFLHAWKLFQRGELAKSQWEAEQGAKRFEGIDPEWSSRFQLLEAKSMFFRGMYEDALVLLSAYHPATDDPDGTVQKLALEAIALARQQKSSLANQELSEAERICEVSDLESCGEVLRARGTLAAMDGKPDTARQFYLETLAFARAHHNQWSEAGTLINLGFAAMQLEHYDEALDWSRSAYRVAEEVGAENQAQFASGNVGWAYLQLGDNERALEQFLQAEKSARSLGNVSSELNWMDTAGYVYRETGDLSRAKASYRRAFDLAKQIDSKEDIQHALEDLAQVSVEAGKLDEASSYIDQVTPLELAGGNRLSANVRMTRGMLAAARGQDQDAESLFRDVQSDSTNPTTLRLYAGDELARLFEKEGDTREAERMYNATLTTFEAARAQLKSEESILPFVANAARIYDDYIHMLVQQGRSDEALGVADQSRARTLAQSLGVAAGKVSVHPTAVDPRKIAKKAGATLLFYWLGQKQSYLWAITPAKITFFTLPAQSEIVARVGRYRKAVVSFEDPLERSNEDGQALYKLLVAPASKIIRPDVQVMILADGELNQLNFDTLLVPGPSPEPDRGSGRSPALHYWIDDATLVSAPSLAMLGAAKPVQSATRSLLLLGNPVSSSEEFPSLPLFGFEMTKIQSHFDPHRVAVFAGQQANPAAYLSSNPAQYSYIHFVSHAVASRTDPLDSAIILSGSGTAASADSFKLYARDIMRHPIDARLVTISACYGSGTRSYVGEGLVGLSWAFLRAGAHSVIAALWEASDDSTPRLMDTLYQGLQDGQVPAAALRKAKLNLLHSNSRFQSPFFWAPFQIYSSQ